MTARLQNAVVTSTAVYTPLASLPTSSSAETDSVISSSFFESRPHDAGTSVTLSVFFEGIWSVGICHSFGIRAATEARLLAAMDSQLDVVMLSDLYAWSM